MDTMIDAVITIDPKGKVLVFNKKAEEFFGYRKKQVLKKNVNMLMPPDVALNHDGYLKTYKRTKKRNIIGIGRQVIARHSDGHEFPIHLSISESKTNDETLFTATIRLITAESTRETAVESVSTSTAGGVSTASPSDMAMFGLLDCLLDATVVIDQNGIIKFWNKAASERLGFSKEEVLGKNIKMCMPSSIAGTALKPARACARTRARAYTTAFSRTCPDKHDAYIQRYMTTGEGKVVGVGRNVVAQKKNGEIVPVHLSLTEQQIGPSQRYFTGVMRAVEEELEQKKTILQQEREIMDGLAVPAMISDETGTLPTPHLPPQCAHVSHCLRRQDPRIQQRADRFAGLQPDRRHRSQQSHAHARRHRQVRASPIHTQPRYRGTHSFWIAVGNTRASFRAS